MRWLPAALLASGLTLLFAADPRASDARLTYERGEIAPQWYDVTGRGTPLDHAPAPIDLGEPDPWLRQHATKAYIG
jgi:hypothetical protein